VREVGRVGETEIERESQLARDFECLMEPFLAGSEEDGGEIEEEGVGSGVFVIRGEGVEEGERFGPSLCFQLGIVVVERELGTAGKGTGRVHSDAELEAGGDFVEVKEGGLFPLS
jgi:hypothetical protein